MQCVRAKEYNQNKFDTIHWPLSHYSESRCRKKANAAVQLENTHKTHTHTCAWYLCRLRRGQSSRRRPTVSRLTQRCATNVPRVSVPLRGCRLCLLTSSHSVSLDVMPRDRILSRVTEIAGGRVSPQKRPENKTKFSCPGFPLCGVSQLIKSQCVSVGVYLAKPPHPPVNDNSWDRRS